jgi:PAS domain S-box-containing protein
VQCEFHMSLACPTLSEQILDAAQDGIICLDLAGRISFANPAAARLLGFTGVDELHGQPVRTYIQFSGMGTLTNQPGDAAGLLLAGMTLLPRGEQVCWSEEGASFPIEYESAPIDEDGSLAGAVVTFRDVGQRQTAERLKNEQISVVSHELRTPLTSMRSALGLLVGAQVGQLPDQGHRLLEIAVRNTDRLIRLINDILDVERLDSGQMPMTSVLCDAGDLMTEAADAVRSMADQAGVVLEVIPNAARLWGDPDRLMQVLINLLANAIKFSPPGGGTVWIDATQAERELVFRVRDAGCGIRPDKLETIFDRFVQVGDGDAHRKGGTGLGLAICRGIVKQHGGHIWAESTVGAGTTLCVALPNDESAISQALLARAQAQAESDRDAAAA